MLTKVCEASLQIYFVLLCHSFNINLKECELKRNKIEMKTKIKRIDTLTGLRFPMMVMVVISHFEFMGSQTQNWYDLYFHNATLAVDFFFIMSGFGLTYKSFATQQPCMDT